MPSAFYIKRKGLGTLTALLIILSVILLLSHLELCMWFLDKLSIRSNIPDLRCQSRHQCLNITLSSTPVDTYKCDNSDTYLLVLVLSAPRNFAARAAIRETWATIKSHRNQNIQTLFVVGNANNVPEKDIEEESQNYHDLVQLPHHESYEALTLKSVLTLKWASMHCANAKYLLKTDDDTYNRLDYFVDFLLDHSLPRHLVAGFCFTVHPKQNPKSKWYLPPSQYPNAYLPMYCSGAGYVLSMSAIQKILTVVSKVRYVRLEDVFITGLCRSYAGIEHTVNMEHSQMSPDASNFHSCAINTHNVKFVAMRNLWSKSQTVANNKSCDSGFGLPVVLFIVILCLFTFYIAKRKLLCCKYI